MFIEISLLTGSCFHVLRVPCDVTVLSRVHSGIRTTIQERALFSFFSPAPADNLTEVPRAECNGTTASEERDGCTQHLQQLLEIQEQRDLFVGGCFGGFVRCLFVHVGLLVNALGIGPGNTVSSKTVV